MNGHYEVSTSLGGARYLHNDKKETIAVFSAGIGDAVYVSVKEAIARAGGSILNLDTGEYDCGSLDQLVGA